jgi:hypothetical protein
VDTKELTARLRVLRKILGTDVEGSRRECLLTWLPPAIEAAPCAAIRDSKDLGGCNFSCGRYATISEAATTAAVVTVMRSKSINRASLSYTSDSQSSTLCDQLGLTELLTLGMEANVSLVAEEE